MPQPETIQLTGPGIGLTFLYYFSMTVVIVVFVGSRSADFTFASPQLHQYGVIAGLVAGVLGTLINRNVTMDIAFDNREQFIDRLSQNLAEIGFELEVEAEEIILPEDSTEISEESADTEGDYLSYFRSGLAGWFAGGIYVWVCDRSAQISSRAINIQRIRKQQF